MKPRRRSRKIKSGMILEKNCMPETRHEDPSQRPFERLVMNFVNDRSDDALSDIVMELDRVANAQADPHAWLAIAQII